MVTVYNSHVLKIWINPLNWRISHQFRVFNIFGMIPFFLMLQDTIFEPLSMLALSEMLCSYKNCCVHDNISVCKVFLHYTIANKAKISWIYVKRVKCLYHSRCKLRYMYFTCWEFLTFGVSAPATMGATIPGTVATVLVIPYKTPAYLEETKQNSWWCLMTIPWFVLLASQLPETSAIKHACQLHKC